MYGLYVAPSLPCTLLHWSVFQKSKCSLPLKRWILLRLYGFSSPVYIVYRGRLAELFFCKVEIRI